MRKLLQRLMDWFDPAFIGESDYRQAEAYPQMTWNYLRTAWDYEKTER